MSEGLLAAVFILTAMSLSLFASAYLFHETRLVYIGFIVLAVQWTATIVMWLKP